MSSADVARDAAITLPQAIEMENVKAIELWLDVVDDQAERTYQLSRLSSADRHRLGDMLTAEVAPETARGRRRPPRRPNHQGPTGAARRGTACRP